MAVRLRSARAGPVRSALRQRQHELRGAALTADALPGSVAAGPARPRLDPATLRIIRGGFTVVGLLFLGYLFVFAAPKVGTFGYDAFAYWSVDPAAPYQIAHGQFGSFVYSPALAQVFSLAGGLPGGSSSSCGRACWWAPSSGSAVGPRLLVLAIPMVAVELYYGNIHLLLAAAIVLGFRYPGTWAFVLLSKVTPGVGLAWFASRREWRSLAIAAAATAAVVGISLLLAPQLWMDWVNALRSDAGAATPNGALPVPLWLRLPAPSRWCWWGGRTGRRWTVVVGAMIALPVIWLTSFAMLAGWWPSAGWRRCPTGSRRRLRSRRARCRRTRPTIPPGSGSDVRGHTARSDALIITAPPSRAAGSHASPASTSTAPPSRAPRSSCRGSRPGHAASGSTAAR